MTQKKVCFLVPARNCAPFLPELVSRIEMPNAESEIVIVDDASTDETLAVAKSLSGVHAIRNETQLGYGGTSKRLYKIALERDAHYAINLHGDLGHPPEAAKDLLRALANDDYDVVFGSRYQYLRENIAERGLSVLFDQDVRHGMPLLRIFGHASVTAVQNALYGTQLYSFHEGMRAANRNFMEWCLSQTFSDWYDFDMNLMVETSRAGWRITEIGVPPHYTVEAASGVPLIRYGLNALWQAVKNNRFRQPNSGR